MFVAMSMFLLLYLITSHLESRGAYMCCPMYLTRCKEPPSLVHAYPYANSPDGMHTIYMKRGNQLP